MSKRQTRRRTLVGMGTTGAALLAGCLGSGGDTDDDGGMNETEGDMENGGGMEGDGMATEFTVEASEGQHLSLATMFVQSNDLFYAPEASGIGLYDDGEPIEGDVTEELVLWDAGTEENEEPGAGGEQAPRQMESDSGPEEDATVRPIDDVDDGYDYPATADVIQVTVSTGSMDG
ncbi:MAG: hypothetical protein ACI80F_002083 [Natronomonas sp.]|jgi:hypothetical protein|uniref:spondin domain-containing protein n=1 Tax=Natronomonas sp. TaxID=2184060 RepID=UPI003988FC0C